MGALHPLRACFNRQYSARARLWQRPITESLDRDAGLRVGVERSSADVLLAGATSSHQVFEPIDVFAHDI